MTQKTVNTILANLSEPVERIRVRQTKQGERAVRRYERKLFRATVQRPTKARRTVVLRYSLNEAR